MWFECNQGLSNYTLLVKITLGTKKLPSGMEQDLGVSTASKLQGSSHVNDMVSKANILLQLSVLKRPLH